MHRRAAGSARIVIAFGVIIRSVAIIKSVGDDLIDVLTLPEFVGDGLGAGAARGKTDQKGYRAPNEDGFRAAMTNDE